MQNLSSRKQSLFVQCWEKRLSGEVVLTAGEWRLTQLKPFQHHYFSFLAKAWRQAEQRQEKTLLAVSGPQALEQVCAGGEEWCSNLLKWRKVLSPTAGQVACSPMEAPHQIHSPAWLRPCILEEKVVQIHLKKTEDDDSYLRQPSGITEGIWELQHGVGVGKRQ